MSETRFVWEKPSALATPAPVHNAANAAAVVITDVAGSNLVIACCPLDFLLLNADVGKSFSPGDFMRSIWALSRLLVIYKLGAKPPIDFDRRLVPTRVQRNAVPLARQGDTRRRESGGEALDVSCGN
jgi:hypothetical protein